MKKKNKKQSPAAAAANAGEQNGNSSSDSRFPQEKTICPSSIKGMDDAGRFYSSHQELLTTQSDRKDEFYHAKASYWESGGYGSTTDDEAMIGDGGGIQDGEESLAFLDQLASFMSNSNSKSDNKNNALPNRMHFGQAVDLGAGVGRVTKLVLLKRFGEVRLVEADEGWSKRSKVYLGRKRAGRCSFVNQRLDDLTDEDIRNWGSPADLMWVQWTLQYMIDKDVVECLKVLAGRASSRHWHTGSERKPALWIGPR